MGRSWQNKLPLTTRLCAVLALVIWIAASGFCSIEQLISHHHGGESQMADSRQHGGHHSHNSHKEKDGKEVCCESLVTVLPSSIEFSFPRLAYPNFASLDFFAPCPSENAQRQLHILRQPPERKLTFTPELCLGPALRSLAPPSFC